MNNDELTRMAEQFKGRADDCGRIARAVLDDRERQAGEAVIQTDLPAFHMLISGALFDFAGFLTTRERVTPFGSSADASPMVELLTEWAAKRGLDLKDPAVQSWSEAIASLPAPQAVQAEAPSKFRLDCSGGSPCTGCPDKKKCQRGCIRQPEFIGQDSGGWKTEQAEAPSDGCRHGIAGYCTECNKQKVLREATQPTASPEQAEAPIDPYLEGIMNRAALANKPPAGEQKPVGLPFAVFDEFGQSCEDRVADHYRAAPHPEPVAPPAREALPKRYVLMVTTAYEQGVGKGRQAFDRKTEIANPYGDELCREAWAMGYDEGKDQASRLSATPPAQAVQDSDVATLTRAIQSIKGSTYNLTKDECIFVLENLRDDILAARTRGNGVEPS